jgi:hypothetical protein
LVTAATAATGVVIGVDADPPPLAVDADPPPVAVDTEMIPTTAMTSTVAPPVEKSRRRRRRLTIGSFFFVFALALIATITITLIAVHARSGYFVGFDGDTVVIYKGQRDRLLWFDPTVNATSTKTRQDLDPTMIDVIETRPTFGSPEEAAAFIANEVTPTTTQDPATTSSTTTPATTPATGVSGTTIAGP